MASTKQTASTKPSKKQKPIKWRVGDQVQYNSDPEDNDQELDTRQGVIKAYQQERNQISIQRDDDGKLYNYFLDDIAILYNVTKNGHPKTTYGALLHRHKQIYHDQVTELKEEISASKQQKDREAAKQSRQKLKELKSQIKSERNEIKRQTQALRKHYNAETDDKYENQHIEEKDCWDYRLPNMQQFIINIPNGSDKKTEKRFAVILKQYQSGQCDSSATIQAIKDWIDDKMPNVEAYATKPKEMSKIISNLAKNIIVILNLLLSDQAECEAICARSYHHDLFEKIVLLTGKKGWKLRLHLFKKEEIEQIQEELHSHRNHFLSTCLYGSITQKVWEVVKEKENGKVDADGVKDGDGDGDGKAEYDESYDGKNVNYNGPIYLHKYTYDPKGDEQNREFNITKHEEQVKLVCVKNQTSKVGDMYYMHPSIIHQVVECHGRTVTLVLNSKTVMMKSCFGTYQQWHSEQFKREKFKADELNEVLGLAVKLIGSL